MFNNELQLVVLNTKSNVDIKNGNLYDDIMFGYHRFTLQTQNYMPTVTVVGVYFGYLLNAKNSNNF